MDKAGQVNALEKAVASCYDTMVSLSSFLTEAVAVSGRESVECYLPGIRDAMTNLRELHHSLVFAPSFSAYWWPNAALHGFGTSLTGIGRRMAHSPYGSNLAWKNDLSLRKAGDELSRTGYALTMLAASYHLYGEGLIAVAISKYPSLLTSEMLVGRLCEKAAGFAFEDRRLPPGDFAQMLAEPAVVFRPRRHEI